MPVTRRGVVICMLVIVLLIYGIPRSSAPLLVDLGYARYHGIRNSSSSTTVFYSIQYAAPPTGNLRWQAPVPVEQADIHKDNALIITASPGPICHQSKPTWQKFKGSEQDNTKSAKSSKFTPKQIPRPQSEDCLRLDVITPTRPASTNLPVVVFIHGGGFVKGWAAQYDGNEFVSFSRGSVIWVQIHYRLGLFGFLGGNEVRSAGTLNAGILDQQLALQWVQKHIAQFGGDPKRVTIWGGSAGGASVISQMVLHRHQAEPPFRAAIAEYPWWQSFHTDEILNVQYNDLLTVTRCSDIACLRGLEEKTLAKAQQGVYDRGWEAESYGYGDFYLGPSVDGEIIPHLPHDSLTAGMFAKVPMILDRAAFEGFLFTNKYISQHFVIQTYLQRLWPQATGEFFSKLLTMYPEESFASEQYFNDTIFEYFKSHDPLVEQNSAFFRTQTIFSDATINCPTRSIARALSQAGQHVWKMHFNAGSRLHATVTKDHLLSGGKTRTKSQLRSYFLAFITSLDPNKSSRPSRPSWSLYSDDTTVLVVDDAGISTGKDSDAGPHCDLFAENHDMVGN